MANLEIAAVTQACRTTTGTQDFTVSGFGTPVAVIFIATRVASIDTAAAHAAMSYGFTDGTRNRCCAFCCEDGQADTDTRRIMVSDNCILFLENIGVGSIEGEADWNAWVTDGVQIDVTVAPGTAFYITAILIKATSAYVGDCNNVSADDDVTDPGFQPDTIFFASTRTNIKSSSTYFNSEIHAALSVGIYQDDEGTAQCSVNWGSASAEAKGTVFIRLEDNTVIRNLFKTSLYGGIQVTDVDSNGFTASQVASAGTSAIYMALQHDSKTYQAVKQSKTTTGIQAFSGFNFQPTSALCVSTAAPALNTTYTNANSEQFGVGVDDDTTDKSHSVTDDDNAGTSNTYSYHSDSFLKNRDTDDGGDYLEATIDSYDADGLTLNWLDVQAQARDFLLFAIQKPPSGYVHGVLGEHAYRQSISAIRRM
jgi:hypothetical protein